MIRLAALGFALVSTASAQSIPGYEVLEAEIRAGLDPVDALVWQAVGVYDRADSVATLVRTRLGQRQVGQSRAGAPGAWPSRLDALALAFVQDDPAVLDMLVAEAARVEASAGGDPALVQYTDISPREGSGRSAPTSKLRTSLVEAVRSRLDDTQIGRAAEAVVLAARGWLIGPVSVWRGGHLLPERQALNADAAAFVRRYPDSPHTDVVRTLVRYRFVPDRSLVGSLALGTSAPTGALATRTEGGPLAVDLSLDIRSQRWHAGLTVLASFVDIRDGFAVGADRAEAGERYATTLVGVEGGPLLRVGVVEAMPYGALGYLVRGALSENGEPREGSTFDLPGRLGLGYGLKLAVRSPRVFSSGPGLHARLGWTADGLSARDGVDLTGSTRLVVVGLSWALSGGRRAF